VVERFHVGVTELQEFLAARAGAPVEVIEEHQVVLFDDDVTVRLFEIAAGLRSSVLGETEVLGQVRRAAQRAEAERASGPVLSGLFQRAVKAGRQVRSSTAIARGATSLSHVAVEMAVARFGGSLADRRMLVVGAGTMGEGIVDALARRDDTKGTVVANRTVSRARLLAKSVGGEGVGIDGLPGALEAADAVLVSTGSSLPVLDTTLMTKVVSGRARSAPDAAPLLVIDASVPRNVDPAVGSLEGVELLDMDDLTSHAERALEDRRGEVAEARAIVQQEVDRYRADERARGAAPIVSALRQRVEQVRQAELERHRHRLERLDDEQWRQVESVVDDVLAKVLHQPTVALKESAGTPRGERLVEALRSLFDL
jgi:glutamyl-tRNA reductase